MDFSATHIGFVIGSYGLSAVFLGALIATTLLRDRRLRAEAERLEAGRKAART